MKNTITKNRNTQNNKCVKICFVGNAIQYAKKHLAIAKSIKEYNVDAHYITYSKESANFFKKKRLNHTYIFDVIDKIKIKNLNQQLKRIEKEYSTNVKLLLFGDYEHWHMRRGKALTLLVKYFIFWEQFLTENKIDYILSGIERLKNMVPRVVSQNFETQYYAFKGSQIKNRFEVNSNPTGHISRLDEYWKKNKHKKLSVTEQKTVEKFVSDFVKNKKRTYIFPKPKIKENVGFFVKRVSQNIFTEKLKNPYASLFSIAFFQVKKVIRSKFVKNLYEEVNPNDKIVFYPLHVEHDAQILVRAPQYFNQVRLIKKISKSLPRGYTLYVKEHPNNVGGMPIKKLKQIKSLSNVKLVTPYFHSHDLIKKSDLIVTINSTVGWEGLIYGKPVVVFGTPFYEISNMIYKVNEVKETKEKINLALNKKIWNKTTLYRFVNALFKSTNPGLAVFQGSYRAEATSKKNLVLISEGLRRELNLKK
jgi:capsule polysaccharide modification protein KpsS